MTGPNLLEHTSPCEGGLEHDWVDMPHVDTAFVMQQCRRCSVVETQVDQAELERPLYLRMREAWLNHPELQEELDTLGWWLGSVHETCPARNGGCWCCCPRCSELEDSEQARTRYWVLSAQRHNTLTNAARLEAQAGG